MVAQNLQSEGPARVSCVVESPPKRTCDMSLREAASSNVRRSLRSLSFLGLAVTLLAAPQRSQAQIGAPLEILCFSQAQDYCVEILSWDVHVIQHPFEVNQAGGTIPIRLYGSAVGRSSLQLFGNVFATTLSGAECVTPIIINYTGITGPGHYSAGSSEPGCQVIGSAPRPPSPADIELLVSPYRDEDGVFQVRMCHFSAGVLSRPEGAQECVSVPEPSPLPLLAAGLFGLGFVAWRRREEEAYSGSASLLKNRNA